MIRHGRHVPSQCPKQKHFPPVLLTIFNVSRGGPAFKIRRGRHVPKQRKPPPEILKMAANTGGEMLLFRALARNMAPMTNHHDSTLRFFD